MHERPTVVIADPRVLSSLRTRRDLLKVMALGGAAIFLPGVMAACKDSTTSSSPVLPGTGSTLIIDFAKGDIAVLQFAYLLEQLEADFYTKVVAAFGGSNLSAAEKTVVQDIMYHEVLHREFLKAALGVSNGFTATPIYTDVNFSDRLSVLNTAKAFEDLGVAAYNGAAQYIASTDYLTLAGKIVSVEARHASAIRDLLNPKSGDFAPTTFDNLFKPATVAVAAQPYIVQSLSLSNAPATFVQGPNNNG
jgi:hypothetical protein